jgi:lathosterol oxidase
MDLVLEVFDTYLFDPVYASLLPIAPKSTTYNAFSGNGSAPIATVRDVAAPQYNGWKYKPASQFLSFTPSNYAYQSSWPRDDPWRQILSLFAITWYAFDTLNGCYPEYPF